MILIYVMKDKQLETFQIYKNLAWLNDLSADEAIDVFRSCSGSELWARSMAERRPFMMLDSLYKAADKVWFEMTTAEWAAVLSALQADLPKNELAQLAGLYKDKFGFIFVLAPDGRSADEMLAICRARLGNSVETELRIAAEEHRKIIVGRLNKLLEK